MSDFKATEPILYCVPPLSANETTHDPLKEVLDIAGEGPWTLMSAFRYCERIAASHYENFPVASRFLPAHLRPHVTAIYAFARTADDFADEPKFANVRQEALARWEQFLEDCYRQEATHPVFIALRQTIREHHIPIGYFKALLTGFRMDLTTHSYGTFTQLRQYCSFSANPIGKLMLSIHGYQEPELHRYSDEICTALQLSNMLQDLSIDLGRGKIYLPEEDLLHFGVSRQELLERHHSRAFKELMAFSIVRIRSFYVRGRPLLRQLSAGLSMEVEASCRGGLTILDRIEQQDYEVLNERPVLQKTELAGIALRSLFSFGRRLVKGDTM